MSNDIPGESVAEPVNRSAFDRITQILLPTLTIGGFLLTSLKHPQYGLILNFSAQIFWGYAAWQSHKKAGQTGILVTTVVISLITAYGVINYWFL